MQMVFITKEFLEVATEGWPEWDLNPQPLNFVQTLKERLSRLSFKENIF